MRNIVRRLGLGSGYAALILWTLFVVAPLLFMFASSVKTHGEILRGPLDLPRSLSLQNYVNVLTNPTLRGNFINSIVVTSATLLILIFVALMAGYAMSRFRFPGSKAMLIGLVVLLAMPAHALVIPIYYFMDELGIRNSLWSLTLLYVALGLPVSIIITRVYFDNLPRGIEEAAMVDGCGTWGVFYHVAIPLSKVAIATVAIINFVGIWSEFLFSSVLMTNPSMRTMPVAVATIGITEGATDLGLRFAGLSLATIPVLLIYAVFSKRIVKGITAGALK